MENEKIGKSVVAWLFGVLVIVGLLCALVVGKVIYLQSTTDWQNNIATIKQVDVEPFRGDICAYDGRVLATSMPSYSVYWDLTVKGLTDSAFYGNLDSLSACMSRCFQDTTKEGYIRRFSEAYKAGLKYYCVKKDITLSQLKSMRNFPIFKHGRYKSGFISEQRYKREQPHKSLASRTIGSINEGSTNKMNGMEAAFDDKLSGIKGIKLMKKLSSGDMYPVSPYGDIHDEDPVDGLDVISTLDVNLQDIVEKSLKAQLMRSEAQFGTVVVMEVKTGKIRAISNLDIIRDTVNNKISYAEQFNHAVVTQIEPGSTMKLASVIACMEEAKVSMMDTVDAGNGVFELHDIVINDGDHPFKGKYTIKEGFEKSSNVIISKLAYYTFKDKEDMFVNRLCKLGLNKPSGIDLVGETSPNIKSPGNPHWSGVSLAQMSYGYELTLTPLQILTFYNAIANNGKWVRPHLLEGVRSHGQVVETVETVETEKPICSVESLEMAQALLRGVVENGTAQNIKNPHYSIAGKTGTAQIAKGRSGYQSDGKKIYTASFVGYFPADNPKYSCIVAISNPSKGSIYGSSVACPVFKVISDKLYSQDRELHSGKNFNLLAQTDNSDKVPAIKSGDMAVVDRLCSTFNVPMSNMENCVTPYVYVSSQDGKARLDPMSFNPNTVPDVIGMGLSDAMLILRQRGYKVGVSGRGVVKKQSVDPGKTAAKGTKINIELG